MGDDFDREAVLAQVAERRRVAAELAAQLPQESATDLILRRNGEQRRARAAGQLDLGGAA